MEQNTKQLTAKISDDFLKGSYSNAFKIGVTDTEVVIDFAFLTEESDGKSIKVVSRMILHPQFAEKFSETLIALIKQHAVEQANAKAKTSKRKS
jgi:hypothetical protein